MNYNVQITSSFKKQAKHLIKKYPSLKAELTLVIEELEINPVQGKPIGNDCYKIRISIASKNKGKSGGARLIIYIQYSNHLVYLLSIYDKSEIQNISDSEIKDLLKYLP